MGSFLLFQHFGVPSRIHNRRLTRMPSIPWKNRLRFQESTQRGLCRFVFFWLALIPCLAVVCFSAVRVTPWYQTYQRDWWQQRISDNLGVDVRFASIDFPSPDAFRAKDLICTDPENGREILKVPLVSGEMDRSGWSVKLHSPELNGQQLATATQKVHDWFLCRPQKSASLLRLSVPELTIYEGANNTRFQDIEVGLKPTDTVSTLIVTFSLENQRVAKPASFRVDRNHQLDSPATQWSLETKDLAIPCSLLSERFPAMHYLGKQSAFKGTMTWAQNDQHWRTTLQGEFQAVDLNMVSRPIGSPASGFGKLVFEGVDVTDGNLRDVRGTVLSAPGAVIDTSWMTSYVNSGQGKAWTDSGRTASLDRLALRFFMSPEGIRLSGGLKPAQAAAYVDKQAVFCPDAFVMPPQQIQDWFSGPAIQDLLVFAGIRVPALETQPSRIAER